MTYQDLPGPRWRLPIRMVSRPLIQVLVNVTKKRSPQRIEHLQRVLDLGRRRREAVVRKPVANEREVHSLNHTVHLRAVLLLLRRMRGQTPVIAPGKSFHYTSGCPLKTPQGIMVGSYQMTDDAGELFDVAIPAFSLDSPYTRRSMN